MDLFALFMNSWRLDDTDTCRFLATFAALSVGYLVYNWKGLLCPCFTHCCHCLKPSFLECIQEEVDSQRLQRAHFTVSFLACIGSSAAIMILVLRAIWTPAAMTTPFGHRFEVEPFITIFAAMTMATFKSMLTMRWLKAVFALICIWYVAKDVGADWTTELYLFRCHLNVWRLVLTMVLPSTFAMPVNAFASGLSILCSSWYFPNSFARMLSEGYILVGLLSASFIASHVDNSIAKSAANLVAFESKHAAQRANAQQLQEALRKLVKPQYNSILLLDYDMQIKLPSQQLANVLHLGDPLALEDMTFIDFIASEVERERFVDDCRRVSREYKKKILLASLRSSIATLCPTLNVYLLHTCFSQSDVPDLYILGMRTEMAELTSSEEFEIRRSGLHGCPVAQRFDSHPESDRRRSVDSSALSDTFSELTEVSGLTLTYSDTTCKSSRVSSLSGVGTQTTSTLTENKCVQAGDSTLASLRPPKLPGAPIARSKAPQSPRSTRSTSDTSYASRRSASPSNGSCNTSDATATSAESSEMTFCDSPDTDETDTYCEFMLGGHDSHSSWDLTSDGTWQRGKAPHGFIRLSDFMALPKDSNGHRCSFGSLDHLIANNTKEFTCDRCGNTVAEGIEMRGCRQCDFDICKECLDQEAMVSAAYVNAVKNAALVDSSWEVRRAALQALPKLGQGEAVLASLKDEDPDVRFACLEVLAQLAREGDGDMHACEVARLLGYSSNAGDDCALDPDPRVRSAAARALGNMSSRSFDVSLLPLLSDDDALVRRWAVWALGRLSLLTPDEELQSRAIDFVRLLQEDPDHCVRRATIIALRTMGEPGKIGLVEISGSVLRDDNPSVRMEAVEALSEMGSEAGTYIDNVIRALKDSSCCVRLAAAKALGKVTTLDASMIAAAARSLAESLTRDDGPGVALACVESLVAMGDHTHDFAAVLAGIVESASSEAISFYDTHVRKAAADALGDMGAIAAEYSSALAAALRKDPSETVRYCAAWALGEIGVHASDQAATVAGALSDKDADVRDAAARALGSMGSASEPFMKDLVLCLKDENADVRTSAVKALQAFGEAAACQAAAIVSVLQNDDSGTARAAAASALGKIGEVGFIHVPKLSLALSDEEDDVRVAAIVSLGEMGERSSVAAVSISPAVVKVFGDQCELVRSFALDAFGRLGDARHLYVKDVAQVLQDESCDIRAAALQVLADLGTVASDYAASVASTLGDEDAQVRAAAIHALIAMGDAAFPFRAEIQALSESKDEDIRAAVAEFLGGATEKHDRES